MLVNTSRDDDDINDVASMAGVNLSEESARILATNSALVGAVTRSCKDEAFLHSSTLERRILEIGEVLPPPTHTHTHTHTHTESRICSELSSYGCVSVLSRPEMWGRRAGPRGGDLLVPCHRTEAPKPAGAGH